MLVAICFSRVQGSRSLLCASRAEDVDQGWIRSSVHDDSSLSGSGVYLPPTADRSTLAPMHDCFHPSRDRSPLLLKPSRALPNRRHSGNDAPTLVDCIRLRPRRPLGHILKRQPNPVRIPMSSRVRHHVAAHPPDHSPPCSLPSGIISPLRTPHRSAPRCVGSLCALTEAPGTAAGTRASYSSACPADMPRTG